MFIENLLNLLKLKGIKQVELCKKIDIPKTSINNWKNGSMPSIETANKIAKELNVTLDYLVNGEEKESRLERLYNMATKDEQKIIDIMLEKYEHQGTSSNYRIG